MRNSALVLSATIPEVIHRDEEFTLVLRGNFLGKKGERFAFEMTNTSVPRKTDQDVPMPEVRKITETAPRAPLTHPPSDADRPDPPERA